ncbi:MULTISPECIES: acyltransferase [Aeromonas]|uniref:acyltransferase n=1 Tax=Aeromonas TaxID=642 RepID=UPI00068F3F63|nr:MULTISPECIES: acyltransferase [Aeromonas]AYK16551.1 acyltransferase [Aeromonas veronii]PNW68738.1 acyltransferase [Aeromonas veronii]TNH70248.1 hexapeptide transferase [Aeromonas veronii]
MINFLKLYARNKVRCQSGNTIEILGSVRVRKCQIKIKGSGNKLILHSGANIKNTIIEIDGNDCELSIGRDCVIGEGCYLSCRERNIVLNIGDHCMFSRNVRVMTSDGHDILKNHIRINPAKNIKIGSHVWLADGVTVLKGATIGNGSIVGVGALLTSSMPSNSISVGIPAKIVKENITWQEDITF